ncbi:MAG TPA: cbb3-type cytochrome c oxidase subunit II [Candidatus Saccharimonadales bacterium]|nr:cbb3-type cytochrome c oxidase subunit II [Candidatus Saccharimonadales bacterium]
MKNGLAVFFAAFIALGGSWTGFVLGPALQLGREKQTTVLNSSDPYPVQRTGEATMGLQVYRANGCAACHTEQIQQYGMACNVVLTSPGKTPATMANISNLVSTLKLEGLNEADASAVSDKITAAGGKTETHIYATGGDISRGWGIRHSVAADYLYDYPVQLGSLRAGPDLAAIGVREPDVYWQLLHLYAPQCKSPNSAMPPFKFLFEVRKIGATPSPDALDLPKEFAPADGYEVVPKPEAKELAAYLLSLHADVPLYEAPFTPLPASTSASANK